MFGNRFKLLSIAGINIMIDMSWFFIALLLSWSLSAAYFPFLYPGLAISSYWVMGILGMLGLFACVVLHELSHAIVAKSYGLPISEITLFIFGGVAEIKKEPNSPTVEFWMAIIGPITSFVLAFVAYILSEWGKTLDWPIQVYGILSYLALVNLILAIFNLLPAFPLDGGRILRALLWKWKGNLTWATRTSTALGSGFGLAMIFMGVFVLFSISFLTGLWFIILGWFLHRAANAMRSQYFLSKELKGEHVSKFMKRDPISVPPDITIQDFIDHFVYQSCHHLYPVAKNDHLMGYVSLQEIKAVPKDRWATTQVEAVMVPRKLFLTVSPETNALDALNIFQQSDQTTLLVVSEDRLVGILTAMDLFKIIALKLELEGLSTDSEYLKNAK